MSKSIFLIAVIFVSAACGFFAGQQTNSSASSELVATEDTKQADFIKVLQNEKIRNFQSWEDEKSRKFFGVVRQLNEPCDKDYGLNSCQKLSIYDEIGKIIYEKLEFGISFNIKNLAHKNFHILMITNSGGTDSFVEIVDYQNGKFIEMIDSDETQFRGGYWTMAEYRNGIKIPGLKPPQLFVIQQQGGTDENPSAVVFRFKEEKYQKVGEIKMQELGDFIEKQITNNK